MQDNTAKPKKQTKQVRFVLNADLVEDFCGACRIARLNHLLEIESFLRNRINELRGEVIRRMKQ